VIIRQILLQFQFLLGFLPFPDSSFKSKMPGFMNQALFSDVYLIVYMNKLSLQSLNIPLSGFLNRMIGIFLNDTMKCII
jgi:hypothetical protein